MHEVEQSDEGQHLPELEISEIERFEASLVERYRTALLAEDTTEANKAFNELFGSTQSYIDRSVWFYASNQHDADEIASEVYRRFWRYLPSFEHRVPVRQWLKVVTRRTASTFYSKKYRQRDIPTDFSTEGDEEHLPIQIADTSANPEDYAIANETAQLIAQLPDRLRSIVQLWVAGYTHAEIAATLNITEANARVRLFRARNKLDTIQNINNQTAAERSSATNTDVFSNVIQYAKRDGFIETYVLLPQQYRAALRWYMASGNINTVSIQLGIPAADVQDMLDISAELLNVGTRDFHQYSAGGESTLYSPMRALATYPVFQSVLRTSDLPADSIRLIKDYVSRRPGEASKLGESVAYRTQTVRFLDTAIQGLGRTVISRVKFEERFAMLWLNTVWQRDDFKDRRSQLDAEHIDVIDGILAAGSLQDYAKNSGRDLVAVWKTYRVAVNKFAAASYAAVRLEEVQGRDFGHEDNITLHAKYTKEIFLHPAGFELNNRYIFMSRTIFMSSYRALSDELGVHHKSLQKRQRLLEEQLPVAVALFRAGFKGFAFTGNMPGEAGLIRSALLDKAIKPAQVRQAINTLSDVEKEIFSLRYKEGWSTRRIADSKEKSTSAIKAVLISATHKIRVQVLPLGEEDKVD